MEGCNTKCSRGTSRLAWVNRLDYFFPALGTSDVTFCSLHRTCSVRNGACRCGTQSEFDTMGFWDSQRLFGYFFFGLRAIDPNVAIGLAINQLDCWPFDTWSHEAMKPCHMDCFGISRISSFQKTGGKICVSFHPRHGSENLELGNPRSLTVFSFSQNEHAWFVCTDLPTFCVMTLK